MKNTSEPSTPCPHDFIVLSYDADITIDPDSPLYEQKGPWILLCCRICDELEIRQYHPGYYVKYTILPYLRGDARDLTQETIQDIHQFIQARPHLVYTILRREILQEQE